MGDSTTLPPRLDAETIRRAIAQHAKPLCGTRAPQIDCLGGHASYRIYHRARHGERSFVIMELRGDPGRSEEVTDGTRPDELPFLTVQRYLAAGGVPVPEVFAYVEDPALVLLEDLGDATMESVVQRLGPEQRLPYYERAIDMLVGLQRYTGQGGDCISFRRRFDRDLLRWELDHFREWQLEAHSAWSPTPGEARLVEQSFDQIADELAALPEVWVHRDYQSRNLMVQPAGNDFQLRLIDFQDALLGPPPYDLVALLRDSYIELAPAEVQRLLDLYLARATTPLEPAAFRRAFWLQTVQRKLKDAGRFIFIDRVKDNPSFLVHGPLTLKYVADALPRLEHLGSLHEVLARHVPELRAPE